MGGEIESEGTPFYQHLIRLVDRETKKKKLFHTHTHTHTYIYIYIGGRKEQLMKILQFI